MYLNYERKVAAGRVRMVNVPHNVAIAAMRLESLVPETHGFPAVKAWVESGGDVNGIFDLDASLPNGVFWHVLSYWRETG